MNKNKFSIPYYYFLLLLIAYCSQPAAQYFAEHINLNAFNQQYFTIETKHFRMHYPKGLKHVAEEVGDILERLYDVYRNRYNLTLPNKTEVLISDDDESGGWALTIKNTIHIWANDFDWNFRGTTNWLENVVAHEYAHIVSIWSSFKMPAWMPYIQYGYFTHPNAKKRIEAFHIFPSEILPPWFFEGIAQYESTVNGGDSWDTHRNMIIRTLSISDKLLSWDHMSVFSGKGADYEKTYNHGFCLMRYIADTYGYEKVVSILREASKLGRVNFDRAIYASLGISGRELYKDWKSSLKKHYSRQVDSLGEQVYGRKINKEGYDNFWPRFSPDDQKIYFLSNGEHDFSIRSLYSYNLSDTVNEKKRIKIELPEVKGFYDIHDPTNRIIYSSAQSIKSVMPPESGGKRARDLFIDNLPKEKGKRLFSKKTKQQITKKQSIFHASFSPSGDTIACTRHSMDKFYLLLADTSGKILKTLYPPDNNPEIAVKSIYSIDWSADGKHIAMSYLDKDNRKIGIFDITADEFHTLCDTRHDERDPRFSPDGKKIYFSSDRSGIFNIYRYDFETGSLQQLTNVSGGAFTPDVSADEKKLVFANYDASGYGIYVIDTVKVIKETLLEPAASVTQRTEVVPLKLNASFSAPRNYSKIPRQFIFIPSFFSEQIIAQNDNAFKGEKHFKIGGVINLVDPLFWAEKGTNIGAFFLLSPDEFLFDRQEIINRKATYDLGVFGFSKVLPLDLSLMYIQRSIAGKDVFSFEGYGDSLSMETLDYNLNPSFLDLVLTHWFNEFININLLAGYNRFKVWVKTSLPGDIKYFDYVPTKGGRLGTYLVMGAVNRDAKMNISPKLFALKTKYEFWNQRMQNEINSFDFSGAGIKENYIAPYQYHQISGRLIAATATPWFKKHDIYTEFNVTAVKLTPQSTENLQKEVDNGFIPSTAIPSYMQPGTWIPGYCYYYKDTLEVITHKKGSPAPPDTERIYMDTVLISGNGVISGSISYRFPLFPGQVDKKLGFIYFDRFYGALNFGGAAAVNKISDFMELRWSDILLYRGVELRLEAISFNTYPLAISARWDYGIDRKAPIGGHRFTLNIGFSFDNWDIITEPDGNGFLPRYFPKVPH